MISLCFISKGCITFSPASNNLSLASSLSISSLSQISCNFSMKRVTSLSRCFSFSPFIFFLFERFLILLVTRYKGFGTMKFDQTLTQLDDEGSAFLVSNYKEIGTDQHFIDTRSVKVSVVARPFLREWFPSQLARIE